MKLVLAVSGTTSCPTWPGAFGQIVGPPSVAASFTLSLLLAEDPYLTGEYGSYIVRGTQQSPIDDRYLSAAVTMKHFQL